MKNIMIVMYMAILCQSAATAQKIDAGKVPAPAIAAFKTKFPAAVNVKWEIEKKDVYEANFVNNKQKQSAQFDKDGKWERTEIATEHNQLPKAVAATFAAKYPGYKITEAEKVETALHKEFYELDIAKGANKLEIQILPNGDVLSSQNDKD